MGLRSPTISICLKKRLPWFKKLQDAVHLVPSLSVLLGLSWYVPRTFAQLPALLVGSSDSKVATPSDLPCDVSHHEPNGSGNLNVGHLKEDLQLPRERKHGKHKLVIHTKLVEVFWYWHMKMLRRSCGFFSVSLLDLTCKTMWHQEKLRKRKVSLKTSSALDQAYSMRPLCQGPRTDLHWDLPKQQISSHHHHHHPVVTTRTNEWSYLPTTKHH